MEDFSFLEILLQLFVFVGGFGMLLYGMHMMSEGLQKSAGRSMKTLMDKLTSNRLAAVGVGAVVTAIVQSSSATTVMVVGFVNASLLTLKQAVGVIMGANIGTTITSWIVSSSEWFKLANPSKVAPLFIGIGAIMIFFIKSKKKHQIGEMLIGLGLLFVGLEFMKDAIGPFRDLPVFYDAFIVLGSNPLLGILAGALITVFLQSSSASVTILQTLAMLSLVPWNAAVYIILGQNIGTTVTAIISSLNASKTAKKAAVVHLLFNVIGTVIFAIGTILIFELLRPEIGANIASAFQISIFHTIFNVGNTVLLFPFAGALVVMANKIIPGEDMEVLSDTGIALRHLDDRILETPQFAVENAIKEVVHMQEYALENVRLATTVFFDRDLDKTGVVVEREVQLNTLERLITDYLVKISTTPLNEQQVNVINNLFHIVNDIERIGDHAENLAELAEYYINGDLQFSDVALNEFKVIVDLTIETVAKSIEARSKLSLEAVKQVENNEEKVDVLEERYREAHIRRLASGVCQTTSGVIFLDAISNIERISDLSYNIALYVKDEIM